MYISVPVNFFCEKLDQQHGRLYMTIIYHESSDQNFFFFVTLELSRQNTLLLFTFLLCQTQQKGYHRWRGFKHWNTSRVRTGLFHSEWDQILVNSLSLKRILRKYKNKNKTTKSEKSSSVPPVHHSHMTYRHGERFSSSCKHDRHLCEMVPQQRLLLLCFHCTFWTESSATALEVSLFFSFSSYFFFLTPPAAVEPRSPRNTSEQERAKGSLCMSIKKAYE